MFWTDSKLEQMKYAWHKGSTGEAIALMLGCTRNAVLGKLNRLGLLRSPIRPRPVMTAPAETQTVVKPPILRKRINPDAAVDPNSPKPQSLDTLAAVLALQSRNCRYPIGSPSQPGFHFCSEETVEGRSYCPEHLQLCVAPIREHRRSKFTIRQSW